MNITEFFERSGIGQLHIMQRSDGTYSGYSILTKGRGYCTPKDGPYPTVEALLADIHRDALARAELSSEKK